MTEEEIDFNDKERLLAAFERELRRLVNADATSNVVWHVTQGGGGVTIEQSEQQRQFTYVMGLIRQVIEA